MEGTSAGSILQSGVLFWERMGESTVPTDQKVGSAWSGQDWRGQLRAAKARTTTVGGNHHYPFGMYPSRSLKKKVQMFHIYILVSKTQQKHITFCLS